MPTQFEWARRGRAHRGPTRPRRAPKNRGYARNIKGHAACACARAVYADASWAAAAKEWTERGCRVSVFVDCLEKCLQKVRNV